MSAKTSNQTTQLEATPKKRDVSRKAARAHWGSNVNLSRVEKVKRWFVGFSGMGYGVSLLVHLVLLIVSSVVILHQTNYNPFGIFLSLADVEEGELEQLLDTRLDTNESEDLFAVKPNIDISKIVQPKVSVAAGGKRGEGGTGFQFSMPKDGRAVIKGSFTAWTVPHDPLPGQAYQIVVQIKLPKNVRRYSLTDLSGLVEGSDTYRQPIPESVLGFLPINDHQTQLVIDVPAAGALVRDKIYIRSRLLNEKQELEIEF